MTRKASHRIVRDPMASITRRIPLAADQQRDLGIAYHASLQALISGHGTEQAWATLACAHNVATQLAEQGIRADALPTIKLAQAALLRSRERGRRTGRWGFDGDGLRLVMAVSIIHDDQISLATRSQIVAAIEAVRQKAEERETV